MTEINLTQSEADLLIAMEKHRLDDNRVEFPSLGGSITAPLTSIDKRENFFLDVRRGRIDLQRGVYQNRARQVVVLIRLDCGGAPHRNPDGQGIHSPHLHIYREGYGDKYAIPVPSEWFPNTDDLWRTLKDFERYCNITRPPYIEKGLFT